MGARCSVSPLRGVRLVSFVLLRPVVHGVYSPAAHVPREGPASPRFNARARRRRAEKKHSESLRVSPRRCEPSAPRMTRPDSDMMTSAARLPVRSRGEGPLLCGPAFPLVCPCHIIERRVRIHTNSQRSKSRGRCFGRGADLRAECTQLQGFVARAQLSARVRRALERTPQFLPDRAPDAARQGRRKSLLWTSSGRGASASGEWIVSSRKCSARGNAARNMFALPGSFSKVATTSPL